MRTILTLIALTALPWIVGCEEDGASAAAPEQPYTDFFTPLPDRAVFPDDNPFTTAKSTLGELLFWDPILSGRMNTSCASCHHPTFGWADGRPTSVGSDGIGLGPQRSGEQDTPFHSPTVLNVGFAGIQRTETPPGFISGPYFWDVRALTLEEQALDPIRSAVEMRSDFFTEAEIFPEIESRLNAIPEYRRLFAEAFPADPATSMQNVASALATFQRTLITRRTRFDDFLDGNDAALNAAELRGLNKFINGGCTDCHSGPMLSDFTIHPDQPIIRNRDAVRTAPLRNVALTAPFMHDGSQRRLRDAIALYEERGDLGVTLEDDDFGDIELFLNTLSNPDFYRSVPPAVPSQLPVGGDITN